MAPYIPPVLFSKEKVLLEIMNTVLRLVITTVGRRLFEDNCERGNLRFTTLKERIHEGLNNRYDIPPSPVPRPGIPPRIKALKDQEVINYWKAMQPDPALLREWYVRDAERKLAEVERFKAGRDSFSLVDYETLQRDLDYEIGQAAYETDLTEYQRVKYMDENPDYEYEDELSRYEDDMIEDDLIEDPEDLED